MKWLTLTLKILLFVQSILDYKHIYKHIHSEPVGFTDSKCLKLKTIKMNCFGCRYCTEAKIVAISLSISCVLTGSIVVISGVTIISFFEFIGKEWIFATAVGLTLVISGLLLTIGTALENVTILFVYMVSSSISWVVITIFAIIYGFISLYFILFFLYFWGSQIGVSIYYKEVEERSNANGLLFL